MINSFCVDSYGWNGGGSDGNSSPSRGNAFAYSNLSVLDRVTPATVALTVDTRDPLLRALSASRSLTKAVVNNAVGAEIEANSDTEHASAVISSVDAANPSNITLMVGDSTSLVLGRQHRTQLDVG
jgi:hypothetical protein